METDQSYSGDSNSSSDSSSDSSEGEEEVLEPVKILGHTLELPQDLCEDYGVFKEFFSMKTWEALDDKHREHLKAFLPKFPDNEEEEQEKTVKMLFNREPFHFTSPLNDFYSNLRQGNYRPDIAKMKKFLLKARAKQQKHKIKSYYAKLLPELLISRERLLAVARAAPPGPVPSLPQLPPRPSTKNNYRPPHVRARQRYFEELAAIRGEVGGEVSDDENYPEGPPSQPSRKRSRPSAAQPLQGADGNISGTLGGHDASSLSSMECLKNVLAAHRARRQYRENHPELNTAGITLDDIKQRVALVNGTKKLMFGGQKSDTPSQKIRRAPKKENTKSKPDAKTKIKEEVETVENKPLLPNIKIKCEQEESDSESSSFVDPVTSPKPKRAKSPEVEIKQEVVDIKYPDNTNIKYVDRKVDAAIKQEPQDNGANSKHIQAVPIKLEDLDGIDMMALPVELADESGDVMAAANQSADTDESLTETTYANFLSLVRALFPARAAHRASKAQLRARCRAVLRSPIAPLNTWYCLSNDWCIELDSALDFLAGERGPHPDDFVPYLQFIPETQMYQWIGAGRDCDAILGRLCERWLRSVSPQPPCNNLPAPRYPTMRSVRAATAAEVAEFRAQERKRFSAAVKPFTYTQLGYRSVVGPCARAPVSCSAHAGLLAPDRPRHATFMSLVRDAVARLPNGEGTRHDILTLLKMSQYIYTTNDQVLLNAVSSALDRMHSAKRDPMVKYDQRSAIWTYLHRNRSEEEWLKSTNRRASKTPPAKSAPPAVAAPSPAAPAAREPPPPLELPGSPTPPDMDMEVAVEEVIESRDASDSDVDVDDSSDTSGPHISSAQLLRQATQASQAKLLIQQTKPKGKLVPTQKKPPPTPPNKQFTPKPQQKTKVPTTPTPNKQNVGAPKINTQSPKQTKVIPAQKPNLQSPKQVKANAQVKPAAVAKQASAVQNKPAPAKSNTPTPAPKQAQPVQAKAPAPPKPAQAAPKPVQAAAKPAPAQSKPVTQPAQAKPVPAAVQQPKCSPLPAAAPQRSPLIKQRPLQKTAEQIKVEPVMAVPSAIKQEVVPTPSPPAVVPQAAIPVSIQQQIQNKLAQASQGTRSLLIRPPTVQAAVASTAASATPQAGNSARRGMVRVLSPAAPASGKSLISPRALLTQGNPPAAKKRAPTQVASSVTTVAQSTIAAITSPSAPPGPRTVQLGARTVQLAPQTVAQPGAPLSALQLSALPGSPLSALQLSALQLAQSVRLPSGQTVQLGPSHPLRAPRPKLTGQTVQIAGQSVQLTGHTVKLPSGRSVQVAGQSVQLPSGQTVQLAGQNIQTVQLGQNVLSSAQSGPSVQLGAQTVQIGGQTVQLAGGQTVQLPSGQTLQLPSGQTVQLSSGQTIQLSGQTVQLASQAHAQKAVTQHLVRSQTPSDKTAQPIVAKLLTNAQGQMISLEGMMSGARTLQLSNVRSQGQKTLQAVQGIGGVRVVQAGARMTRPLILTAAKPLHNIILQQDGSAIRVTSSGGSSSTQAIVLSNIGAQTVTTPTNTTPVLKLQQGGSAVTVPTSAGAVRSVLMDGQQLKLVGGRHVLARLLRPNLPPQ